MNKKKDLNSQAKHSFYECAKNAGLLRNGRPKRAAQKFGDLKKELAKKGCRNVRISFD